MIFHEIVRASISIEFAIKRKGESGKRKGESIYDETDRCEDANTTIVHVKLIIYRSKRSDKTVRISDDKRPGKSRARPFPTAEVVELRRLADEYKVIVGRGVSFLGYLPLFPPCSSLSNPSRVRSFRIVVSISYRNR